VADLGHIELERRIDSITIGHRHRADFGDIDGLMRSIENVGMLQPVTITPDGVLVCGLRRLEAVRRLGWRTLRVWVRSGVSDRLSQVLAQQDENAQRKPLSPLEATELYLELKQLYSEDAARRQAASRFGSRSQVKDGSAAHGAAPATARGDGDSRVQAARMVTGDRSYNRLERIAWLKRVASDSNQSFAVRRLAARELSDIETGAPVAPAYDRVKAAIDSQTSPTDSDELAVLAAEALARVKRDNKTAAKSHMRAGTGPKRQRSLRSFILTWTDLDGWTELYDAQEIAAALSDDDWHRFERVLAETTAFAESVRTWRADRPA
jgi:ParB family chromosome partitioning protein